MLVEPPNVLLGGNMRHFKKIDWPISLSLLFACVLIAIAACVEPSGPLGEAHVIEGGTTVVASVQITLAQSTLAPGKTTQATVVAKSADGKVVDGHVDFVSQNPSIAAVSSNGVVTAVAAGIAVIQATVAGHGATAPVTVQSSISVVAAVAVAFDSTKISVGHVAQASAIVKDTAGNPITGQTITWSSLTPTVASVSSSGAVTAIAAGMASIEATASGVNGSATIAVEAPQGPAPAVAAVAVAFDSTTISVGHITQASAVVKDAAGNIMGGQTITWSSLTPGIASVSSSGVVTALAQGTASIRATASAISGSATITVVPPPVAVVIVTVDSTTLSIGHTAQAYATAKDAAGNPINGQTIVWTSLSPAIASVSSSGKVTALAIGIAVIQATISGCSGSSPNLTVTAPPSELPIVTPDLASQNFDGGSYSPYYNFWDLAIGGDGSVDVVDDPTGAGKGKVARMHYVHVNSGDKNIFLQYDHQIGLDSTIYFRGQFYIDVDSLGAGGTPGNPGSIARKLVYYRPYQPVTKYGGAWREYLVLVGLVGNDLWVYSQVLMADGTMTYRQAPIYIGMRGKTWYTLETQIKMETAIGTGDGILRVWLDGVLLYSITDLHLSDPAWIGQPIPGGNSTPWDPADYYLKYVYVGQQVNIANDVGTFDEYRYWDNVAFSTKRIGQ